MISLGQVTEWTDGAGIVQRGCDLSSAEFRCSASELRDFAILAMNEAYRQSAEFAFRAGWDRPSSDEYQEACADVTSGIRKLCQENKLTYAGLKVESQQGKEKS